MLTQAQVESRQLRSWTAAISSANTFAKPVAPEPTTLLATFPEAPSLLPESATARIYVRGLEFVALPGTSEKLQVTIARAMRNGDRKLQGFCGCMVLFSEQEARLVTVITLWASEKARAQYNDETEQLSKLIEPYVDRWLRTRSFNTLLCTP